MVSVDDPLNVPRIVPPAHCAVFKANSYLKAWFLGHDVLFIAFDGTRIRKIDNFWTLSPKHMLYFERGEKESRRNNDD